MPRLCKVAQESLHPPLFLSHFEVEFLHACRWFYAVGPAVERNGSCKASGSAQTAANAKRDIHGSHVIHGDGFWRTPVLTNAAGVAVIRIHRSIEVGDGVGDCIF